MSKSQTSTEYLVILAVVIVIALVVAGVLGGIPGISGGSFTNAARASLEGQEIGVTNYAVGTGSSKIVLRNNQLSIVRINDIQINAISCNISSFTLKSGESRSVNCINFSVSESNVKYEYPITINWTSLKTDATYVQGLDSSLTLVGTSYYNSNPEDITRLTLSGSGAAQVNGRVYGKRTDINGKVRFSDDSLYGGSGAGDNIIYWTGTEWRIRNTDSGDNYYISSEDTTYPWDVVTWTPDDAVAPAPTFGSFVGGTP